MEMINEAPAQIWRMLIPSNHWMFPEDMPQDELIFHYRDHIYFVNNDGSVLSMPKPACYDLLDLGTLLEYLATSDDTVDFDDEGEFEHGSAESACYSLRIEKRPFCLRPLSRLDALSRAERKNRLGVRA
jgi:hypothetical protein